MAEVTQNSALMGIGKIVMYVFVVIAIIFIIMYTYNQYKRYQYNNPMLVKDPKHATSELVIKGDTAPQSIEGKQFSYSYWMYINEWEAGRPKCVFYRGDADCKSAAPSVWLYPNQNNLMVRVNTEQNNPENATLYGDNTLGDGSGTNMNPNEWIKTNRSEQDKYMVYFSDKIVCDVSNIPLQRWVHVVVTLWDRSLDVYINGKLARSGVLSSPPVLNNGDIHINKDGGFNGYMSKMQYFNTTLNPHSVLKLYREGPMPGQWWWNKILDEMKFGFNFNADNTTQPTTNM
jgi:hypothetical protein